MGLRYSMHVKYGMDGRAEVAVIFPCEPYFNSREGIVTECYMGVYPDFLPERLVTEGRPDMQAFVFVKYIHPPGCKRPNNFHDMVRSSMAALAVRRTASAVPHVERSRTA